LGGVNSQKEVYTNRNAEKVTIDRIYPLHYPNYVAQKYN